MLDHLVSFFQPMLPSEENELRYELTVECLEVTQNVMNLVENLSQIQTVSPEALKGAIAKLLQLKVWLSQPKID